MKKTSKKKRWTEMTTDELAVATQRFDQPIAFEETRPLSPAERARWNRDRAAAKRSGKQRTVKVRLNSALLQQFDEFAKRNNMTLDELITRGIRSAMAFVS
jgi:hypothetical protein